MRAALDAIVADPTVGEDLRDRLAGFRRVRIGRWRIVYRERPGEVEIRVVGPRGTVYSELIADLERNVRERGRSWPARRAARISLLERMRSASRGVRPKS